MKKQELITLIEDLHEECFNIIKSKNADYSKENEDQLAHFKESAIANGLEPLQVWGVFAKKHVDAVQNYIKSNGKSESEPIRNRIVDVINYYTLLLALINDKEKEDSEDFEYFKKGVLIEKSEKS